MELLYGCRSFVGEHNKFDALRNIFLSEATAFSTSENDTLAHVVIAALEQARCDLAALRLYDLDHNEREWTMAAGLPLMIESVGMVCVALFE